MFRFLAAVILIQALSAAQTVDSAERDVYIEVLDSKTGASLQLAADYKFEVKFDGKLVPVLQAERKDLRPKVAILLDTSGSMIDPKAKFEGALQAVEDAVETVSPQAKVSLFAFWGKLIQHIPDVEPSSVRRRLDQIREGSHAKGYRTTRLWDAVMTAMATEKLGSGDAIVLITDGGDNGSLQTEGEVQQTLTSSGVRAFGIIFMDPQAKTPEEISGPRDLKQMTENSGGNSLMLVSYSNQEQKTINQIGRSILNPVVLRLQLPDNVSGNLKVRYLDGNGKRMKNVSLCSAKKLSPKSTPGAND
jgi:hypothetical protein